jgi:TatD DNase family protein
MLLFILILINNWCVFLGLDFNRDFSPREIQLEVFEKQVRIACDLKQKGLQKPLLIHERDAHKQVLV